MAANARVIRQPNNYNDAGALVVTEYRGEVAQKKIPGKAIDVKFGRNADISTGSIPEDVWIGGGEYQGFNPSISGGQRVSILGGANDTGQVVVSGTTTGGNSDYITVTGGDFLGSGVQNGDVLINDTRNAHGIVTNVTASTVTVFRMDGAWNSSEDKFRIARATGTGAGVVKFKKALRNNFVGEYSEYVVLNGTNPVGSANDEYIRCSRCSVVAAGSNGTNVGAITGRQAVTTANVFFIIGAEDGQTLQCVTTVPAEQTYLIETYITGITRLTGAAGAATVQFETRKYGESWVVLRSFDLQTGARINIDENGGTVLCGGTDIRCRVTRVSDNSTVIDASLEYLVTMIPDREVEL